MHKMRICRGSHGPLKHSTKWQQRIGTHLTYGKIKFATGGGPQQIKSNLEERAISGKGPRAK